MGIVNSTLRGIYFTCAAIYKILSDASADFSAALARVAQSPGLPVPNPTASFWQQHPSHPHLTSIQSPSLPEKADIVIIGSGVTSAAVAKTLLEEFEGTPHLKGRRVLVLEARTLCSGATGRNGGHIKCAPYETYAAALKDGFSAAEAQAITRFQLSHLDVLVGLCRSEGWEAAECREVETVDAFFDAGTWGKAKKAVALLEKNWKEMVGFVKVWEREDAIEKFNLSSNVQGALSYQAGALWPYRLVTSCYSSLLEKYPDALSVETNTPVLSIATSSNNTHPLEIVTPRGTVSASHIIHATNGHAANLIPGLRSKLFPIRGHMSAQQPGTSLPDLNGSRSWSFINKQGFEYITQRPGQASTDGIGGEIMAGGGLFQSAGKGLDEIGVADDSGLEHMTASHLSGVLPMGFGADNWGEEQTGRRVKNIWSGILGFTPDRMPLVGKLDHRLTAREIRASKGATKDAIEPAEWIAAGYNGEGMVHAWLCGVAVALQVLGRDGVDATASPGRLAGKVEDWLPKRFEASMRRIERLNINEMSLE